MESHRVKWSLLCLFLLVIPNGRECCFEEERLGLLKFKASVGSDGYDADHLLPSWVDDPTSECCEWERVTCDPHLGHVIDLFLIDVRQTLKDEEYPTWLLNISLFQHFKQLRSLNLSSNMIDFWTEHEGYQTFSRLRNLETLDLSYNRLNRSIMETLGATASLKNLFLAGNKMRGFIPLKELSLLENLEMLDLRGNQLDSSRTSEDFKSLSKLSKLKYLDLSYNLLEKNILRFLGLLSSLKSLILNNNRLEGPLSRQELSNLRNVKVLKLSGNRLNGTVPIQELIAFRDLEIIDLSQNEFSGSIPPFIGALSSLKTFFIAGNQLSDSLSFQGFCGLKQLEELDLSFNNFEGSLPPCLNNLTSLRMLDLSGNNFKGNISASLFVDLKSLECLDLGGNDFKGLFLFGLFANHSKLEVVQFFNDGNNKLEIDTEYPEGWFPSFQLKILVLFNCNLKDIPRFLLHQYQLRSLHLSRNNITGHFPHWLLENNTKLEGLSLKNNSFNGQFYSPLSPRLNMRTLDVSDNKIEGELQENMGIIFPYLEVLNLSKNAFQGSLPSSIGDMTALYALDVSSNNFSGEVPKALLANCTNLNVLVLSYNRFHGQIFSVHFNLSEISVLGLRDNFFTGNPSHLQPRTMFTVKMLDVGNNRMTGMIPSWIANLTDLDILVMRNNYFKGGISCELLSMRYVDLSRNLLSGPLPICSSLPYYYPEHIHLEGNKFTGSIPDAFLNSSSLLTLNLNDNHLFGKIPDTISVPLHLRILLLSRNDFSGLIPEGMCKLKNLSLVDLSKNSFYGSIPLCFYNITFGKLSHQDIMEQFILLPNIYPFTFYSKFAEYTSVYRAYGETMQIEVDFVTKNRASSYKGHLLNLMSGLDLSCNNLTGEIPSDLGKLSGIHGLNLSHNQLTGSIPASISNLREIESLDLSCNKLSGEIPSTLVDLNFLEVFSVAHNNLSGRVPDMKAQFGTFDANSYEGNPFLCGKPMEQNCAGDDKETKDSTEASVSDSERKWVEYDHVVFSASFSASFITFFLGVLLALYINPQWRRRWFDFVEDCMYSCYYFVYDIFHKLSARLYH